MHIDSAIHHRGRALDTSAQAFGSLRESDDIAHDFDALRARLAVEGYVYLPDYLDRDLVLEARRGELEFFAEKGFLDLDYPLMDGVVHPKYVNEPESPYGKAGMQESPKERNPALMDLLYEGRMISFYEGLFQEEVIHFDYTWQRAKTNSDDSAAQPHCDIVFMGRGTKRLHTSWTPLGDIPIAMGGLMMLEGSHHLDHVKSTYGTIDVDRYCTNYDDVDEIEAGTKIWQDWVNNGSYNSDAIATRDELGGRWLTTDYRAGDLLVFGMFTMHSSMDNTTGRFRISTDTRYQPASEPIDERWIGDNPIKHGPEGKVGMIC